MEELPQFKTNIFIVYAFELLFVCVALRHCEEERRSNPDNQAYFPGLLRASQ
jgi:hypothetical protein